MSLHIHTTALNSLPTRLISKHLRPFYSRSFDLGAVITLLLFVVVQLLLPVAAVVGLRAIWVTAISHPAMAGPSLIDSPGTLLKRAALQGADLSKRDGSPLLLRPLIPGLTVAWSTLPLFFAALLVAQMYHELGHALAAAIDGLPTLSVGAHLWLVFPTLYVALPTPTNPLSDVRIACAGVWHNVILLAVVYLFSSHGLGLGKGLMSPFYEVSHEGVIINSISSASPLLPYLRPGDRIIKLDDLPLTSTNTSQTNSPLSIWTTYLNSPLPPTNLESQGWCLDLVDFSPSPLTFTLEACCSGSQTEEEEAPQVCFVGTSLPSGKSQNVGAWQSCLDPLPFWPPSPDIPQRCVELKDCDNPNGSVCAKVAVEEEVLRLETSDGFLSEEGEAFTRIVVYQGDKAGVFSQVQVTEQRPRFWFVPSAFQRALEEFLLYTHSLSLAVGFFNLLPLPSLDGHKIISSFLACLSPYPLHSPTQIALLEEGVDINSFTSYPFPPMSPSVTSSSPGVESTLLMMLIDRCRRLSASRDTIERRIRVLRRWNVFLLFIWVSSSVVKALMG